MQWQNNSQTLNFFTDSSWLILEQDLNQCTWFSMKRICHTRRKFLEILIQSNHGSVISVSVYLLFHISLSCILSWWCQNSIFFSSKWPISFCSYTRRQWQGYNNSRTQSWCSQEHVEPGVWESSEGVTWQLQALVQLSEGEEEADEGEVCHWPRVWSRQQLFREKSGLDAQDAQGELKSLIVEIQVPVLSVKSNPIQSIKNHPKINALNKWTPLQWTN